MPPVRILLDYCSRPNRMAPLLRRNWELAMQLTKLAVCDVVEGVYHPTDGEGPWSSAAH